MILSDKQIKETVKNKEIEIIPFEDSQVQPASYDLRVGRQGATTTGKRIIDIEKHGYIAIEPGDFAIISVLEEIKLGPQYVGRIGLRSKYIRKGLIATTGPQVDPGYHGRLKIGLTNLTPKSISLPFKDDFVSLEIHKLEKPAERPYNGPYQGQTDLSPEDIEAITEGDGMAFSEVIVTLRSLAKNMESLSKEVAILGKDMASIMGEVKTLRWLIPLIVTSGIAIIAIIIAIVK